MSSAASEPSAASDRTTSDSAGAPTPAMMLSDPLPPAAAASESNDSSGKGSSLSKRSSPWAATHSISASASSNKTGPPLPGADASDLVFSPSSDVHYDAALPMPLSEARKKGAKPSDKMLALQAIRRFKLDDDLSSALLGVDFVDWILPDPPALTAIFISAGDVHRVPQSSGALKAELLPSTLVQALIKVAEETNKPVTIMSAFQQFIEDRNLTHPALADINYFAGVAVKLPPTDSAAEVSVGLVAVFDK